MKFINTIFFSLAIIFYSYMIYSFVTMDLEQTKHFYKKKCKYDNGDLHYEKCVKSQELIANATNKDEIFENTDRDLATFIILLSILFACTTTIVYLLFIMVPCICIDVDPNWNPITNIKKKQEKKRINKFYQKHSR